MREWKTIHNIYIDGGYLFTAGSNNFNGGLLMFALFIDPWKPIYAGAYDTRYVHDVYVRGTVLAYLAEIDDGLLTILDVSDHNDIKVLGSRTYEGAFTHNTWLNDDSTVCFTTDELSRAYIHAFDITDPADIKFLDRIRSSVGEGQATPHNTHVLNDYLITSYYKGRRAYHRRQPSPITWLK